ncbi:ATP-binding protein [Streptomyces sp. NBC_01498]|uniref:ATP-binding protein n=1 Tax=Streptomyces sp. NBC_01498 TaxID=2975870 RepID=UPI002E7B8100|nr:ATP-binding protein [Streptomyces sp. NBC_01498]WTL28395.1 ATP-binding protein [Streptomyces sp. NBC_01498]
MTSPSEPAVVLGAVTVVMAAVALLLALSRRKQTRRSREMDTALKSAEARTRHAELRAHGAESRARDLEAREERFRAEVGHLASARLPALRLSLISSHHPVPGLLHEREARPEETELLDAVLGRVSEMVLTDRRRVDAAARAALRGASQDSQALSYRLQSELDALQREFTGSQHLTHRILAADHLNEQNLRLIQRTAIVCGAWPGHVRKDTYVAEIVMGASSRLRGFDRIKINSRIASNVGIVGRAAEPVAVACAELMANALEHSRDDLAVEVSLIQTGNGNVCITIDDAGKGMTAEATARGVRLLSADSQDVMLTELGDPPSQGFAAIGNLVADYGFRVSIDTDHPSPYGGVRAVVTIPPNLLAPIDEEAEPQSAMAAQPAVAPKAERRPSAVAETVVAEEKPRAAAPGAGDGLPQRRRRGPSASASGLAAPTYRAPDPERSLKAWSEFQDGLESGRTGTDSEETL